MEIITPFEICCGFGIGMRIDYTLWVKALYAIIVWPGYYLFKHVFAIHNTFCDPRLEVKASVICAMVTAFVVEINQGMIFIYDNNNFFGIGDLTFAFAFTLIAAMVLLSILWSKKINEIRHQGAGFLLGVARFRWRQLRKSIGIHEKEVEPNSGGRTKPNDWSID